jgi:hypothetical protein
LATTLQFGADPPKNSHPKKPKTYEVPLLKEGEIDKGWSLTTFIRKKGGKKAVNVIYYHTDEWTLSTPNPMLGLVLVVAGQRRANFCLLSGWKGSKQHVTIMELVQWRTLSGGPFELII